MTAGMELPLAAPFTVPVPATSAAPGPADPKVQRELATARWLLRRGDAPGAAKLLTRALKTHPDAYALALALSELLGRGGRQAQALEVLDRAARASRRLEHLLDAAGRAHRAEDVLRAITLLDAALLAEPSHVQARLLLGQLLMVHGDANRAAAVLRPVLEQQPDNAAALEMLACIALGASARLTDLTLFRRLLEVSPDRRRALTLLATAERYAGDLPAALAHSAEALDPADPATAVTHADLLELDGRGEEALALLRPLAQGTGPLTPQLALTLARLLGRAGCHDQALGVVDRGLAAAGLTAAQASALCLRRGSLLDRLGRHEQAWKAWSEAKLLQKGLYDAKADRRRVSALRAAFAQAPCLGLARAQPDSPRPVLVLGMYRSGTTLLEQILTMHPDIGGADEVLYLNELAARILAARRWPAHWTPQQARATSTRYRSLLARGNAGKPVVVDKNPRNWEVLGLAALLCPDAVVVHMDRHPLDVCVSSMATGFSHLNAFAADPKSFAAAYALQAETMQAWKTEAPLPILTLRYEDLVREPEARIREVLAFAGLPWDARCLDFWKSGRLAFTPSQDQVREPLSPRSINRWRRHERALGPARELLEARGICCAER